MQLGGRYHLQTSFEVSLSLTAGANGTKTFSLTLIPPAGRYTIPPHSRLYLQLLVGQYIGTTNYKFYPQIYGWDNPDYYGVGLDYENKLNGAHFWGVQPSGLFPELAEQQKYHNVKVTGPTSTLMGYNTWTAKLPKIN